MEDLVWLRDEVNEPLGLLPSSEQRLTAGMGRMILPVAAPAVVAVAMAAFTFASHDAPSRAESLAAKTEAPPAAARAEPPPPRGPGAVDKPAAPPIATADQIEAASGVKVTRPGGPAAPIPLIIDVQQALAAAKAKAAPGVQR
jgi:hypothetical protein